MTSTDGGVRTDPPFAADEAAMSADFVDCT